LDILKKVVHKNKWFSIEKHILGGGQEYFFLDKKPTVFIITETEDKKIVLVKEYRYPIKQTIWQLPAGMVEDGNELSFAKKELLEETGLKARSWHKT
jgi:ADP-ribose pyrophosphatase